jgi:acetyl esterase/lipase
MKKSRPLVVLSALVVSGALTACGSSSSGGTAPVAAASSQPKVLHSYPHLTASSTWTQVIIDPAFAGFGAYMAPTEDPAQTSGLKAITIKAIAPFIGWHDPQAMADGLNFMIDEVNAGETLWHPLYTTAEIAADPSKKAAGLWLIPGDPGKPLAVIAAGGAFRAVESVQEAFPLAEELHGLGYNVAILKYRVNPQTGQGSGGQGTRTPAEEHADEDMVAAMNLLKANTAAWQLSFSGYSVWGSSAGGMIVSRWAALDGPDTAKASGFAEPAVVVNAYTPPQEIKVSASLPPYFITDAADDQTVSPAAVAQFAAALKAVGGVVDFERYPTGGHGFGIGAGTSANGWVGKAVAFWKAHMTS